MALLFLDSCFLLFLSCYFSCFIFSYMAIPELFSLFLLCLDLFVECYFLTLGYSNYSAPSDPSSSSSSMSIPQLPDPSLTSSFSSVSPSFPPSKCSSYRLCICPSNTFNALFKSGRASNKGCWSTWGILNCFRHIKIRRQLSQTFFLSSDLSSWTPSNILASSLAHKISFLMYYSLIPYYYYEAQSSGQFWSCCYGSWQKLSSFRFSYWFQYMRLAQSCSSLASEYYSYDYLQQFCRDLPHASTSQTYSSSGLAAFLFFFVWDFFTIVDLSIINSNRNDTNVYQLEIIEDTVSI